MAYRYTYRPLDFGHIAAAIASGDIYPPNYDKVVQLLGKTYKSEVDDMYYKEDLTDNELDILIGDSPTIRGNGLDVLIPLGTTLMSSDSIDIEVKCIVSSDGTSYNIFSEGTVGGPEFYYFYIKHSDVSIQITSRNNTIFQVKYIPINLSTPTNIKITVKGDEFGDVVTNIYDFNDNLLGSDTISGLGVFGYTGDSQIMNGSGNTMLGQLLSYNSPTVNFNAQTGNGTYGFNRVNKAKLPFIGDLTNIHGTSNLQAPYAHLNGCDMWYDETNDLWKNTPLQDDGTSCQGENDTDDDGYVWMYKVEGKGLNDKEGLNGTETLYQPEASTELKAIETANFTTRIWYDALGNALPIDARNVVLDYEEAKIWFANTQNKPYLTNWLVYNAPQNGTDYNKAIDFTGNTNLALSAEDGTVPDGNDEYLILED